MGDRPFECSHCKKPIAIRFKEIVDQSTLCSEMCATCPVLEARLKGLNASSDNKAQGEHGICCGHCSTSLDTVRTGSPLGCSNCYTVFGDVIVNDLIASDRLPPALKKNLAEKKTQQLHIGKTPASAATVPSTNKLLALSEALNEALKKENYEQAAWIRDQIKTLTEKVDGAKS